MRFRSVRGALAVKVMFLPHALEALAFGAADHIDEIARLKLGDGEIHFAFRKIDIESKFTDEPLWFRIGALENAEFRFAYPRFLLYAKPNLHGRVAIVLVRQPTKNDIIARRDHGHRMKPTIGIVDAGHADFLS
jgi:hypothetical protein